MAITGWIDDKKGLPIRTRLAAQTAAAAWAIWLLSTPAHDTTAIWILAESAFFFMAALWLINAYNFMDGIDGLATGEAIAVATAIALLYWGDGCGTLALIIALAVAGFAPWNRPPAKMFMGDAGSGFLGFIFAILWQQSYTTTGNFYVVPILLGVFIVDATCTLLWRMYNGEKWYESHRSHAYQYAAQQWGHTYTTIGALAITVFWLTPCAALCLHMPTISFWLASIAYAPLFAGYFFIKLRFKPAS